MKFLDRLKRKPPTEPPLPAPKKAPEPKADVAQAYKPDVKGASPTPATPLTMSGGSAKKGSDNDLRLEIGDFLHRIPAHLLLSGPHDLKAELRFDIGELSEQIAKGRMTISLAEIYRRVPTIFRGEILESDNIEVRFPWQKLAKLVNIPKPATPTEGAAPALAEKLRAKNPDHSIKTADEAMDLNTQPPPVLPGRSGPVKGASWFSKTDAELSLGLGTPAPAPTSTKSADLSSVPPPPLKVQPMTISRQQSPESAGSASQVTPAPQPVAGFPEQVKTQAPPAAGDLDRQIRELSEKCRTITEARDKANAEALKLRVELDERVNELAQEQTANSMTRELVQRHQKEREGHQAQIDVLTAQLDGSGMPVAASLDDDGRVAALTQERDALLQQKTYLSSQLAEMMNRRAGPPAPSPGANGHRQVEELQRRILMLEASQKEAAQELSREKESKGKVEKLLANADRLQKESALHMEEAKIAMRKELEASFRKQVKELEDQLHSKLQAAPVAAAEENGAAAFQAEAIAQLEADIENYRDRMKMLIRERDEARAASSTVDSTSNSDLSAAQDELGKLRAGSAQLAAELGELRNENAALQGIHTELENSRHRISQLQAELSNVLERAQESDALRTQLSERDLRLGNLETARATANNLTAATVTEAWEQVDNIKRQLEQQTQEHAAEISKLSASVSGNRPPDSLLQDFANLRSDHAQTSTLLAEVHQQLESARRHLQKQAQEHGAILAEKEARIRELSDSREGGALANSALLKIKADFENEIARQNAERQQWDFDRASLIKDQQTLREQLRSLQTQFEGAIIERDNIAAERDVLANDLRAESLAHEELLTVIDKDHTSVVQAKDQLVRQLAAAEEARCELEQLRGRSADAELQAENVRLHAELAETRRVRDAAEKSLDSQTASLHENEAILVRLTAENQHLTASMQEFEHLRNSTEGAANVRIQELESERNMLATELSASRKQHQQLIASLDNERGELVTGREAAEQSLASAERDKAELEVHLREAASALDAERQKAANAESELHNQFRAQAAEIEQRHTSVIATTQADLDATRQLLAELRTASAQERDSYLAKQAELEAKTQADNAEFAQRLAAFEQERSALQTSLAEFGNHEQTIAKLRDEREHAVATLTAAERNHAGAILEIEQRFRDGMAGPARELEQLRITSDTLRAELIVARKMQSEIVGSLERDREQHLAARAEWEKKISSVDEARRQMSGRLDDREQAIRLLEEKLTQANGSQEGQRGELAELRTALDRARQEAEAAAQRASAHEGSLRAEMAVVARKLDEVNAQKWQSDGRAVELESQSREERARIEADFRAQFETLTAARDSAMSELEAERAGRQDAIAAALAAREEASKNAIADIGRIEQELVRTRDQRELFKREKDELARRIAQITDQQKRMLDDMAAGLGHAPLTPPRPAPQPTNVIEVNPEEMNVSLPRIRPVQVRPPQVKIL